MTSHSFQLGIEVTNATFEGFNFNPHNSFEPLNVLFVPLFLLYRLPHTYISNVHFVCVYVCVLWCPAGGATFTLNKQPAVSYLLSKCKVCVVFIYSFIIDITIDYSRKTIIETLTLRLSIFSIAFLYFLLSK